MKNYIKVFIFFIISGIYSQSPDWSVNTSNFQYSMTITTFLNVNGTTLTNSNDKVGAFVNNENRGEATVVYNANAKKYLAYLTVYGNTGETINFKIYDSQNNQIVTTTQTEVFAINENIGGVFQSFSVAEPVLSKDAEITSFSLKDVGSETTISNSDISVTVDTSVSLTNLIPVFTTLGNSKAYVDNKLVSSGVSNFDFTNAISFDVLSEDESVLKTYTVTVSKSGNLNIVTANISSTRESYNTNPINVNLVTSETVSGISVDDFELTNCVISSVSSSDNSNFNLEILPIAEGNFSIKLKENAIDDANKTNNSSNILALVSDSKNPFIRSINKENPTENIVTQSEVSFTVIFNEAVTNVSANDFVTVNNGVISIQKNSDSEYSISISNLANYKGVIAVYLNENNDITDLAGNSLQISKIVSYAK